ncbi:hypothetical protein GCM10009560_47710 [Nonomuraea longicatena]|uniref:Transposase n=1 Tax=Nonomuraea longicatena TaxID=83682 RepID=A0ABP4AQF2_9ACTN
MRDRTGALSIRNGLNRKTIHLNAANSDNNRPTVEKTRHTNHASIDTRMTIASAAAEPRPIATDLPQRRYQGIGRPVNLDQPGARPARIARTR